MDVKVIIDWKSCAALGGSTVFIILANKLDTESAEAVFIHAVDAVKGLAVALCNR